MRKLIFLLTLLFVLLFPGFVFAVGTVVQGDVTVVFKNTFTLTFTCTGDAADGSIPNTDVTTANTTKLKGLYLYKVEAFPTSEGTAPNPADVMVYDEDGLDLLGSEDGGTTAYAGLTLVHATLKRTTLPNLYLPRAGNHVNYFPQITGVLTLDVDNQTTASANWTIVLTFVR